MEIIIEMKRLILVFLIFATIQGVQAQENYKQFDIEWLNAKNEVIPEKRLAKYSQRVYADGRFEKLDLSNRVISSGKYVSKEDRRFHGEISYFNRGGNLIRTEEYDKGRKLEFPISTMDIKQDYDVVGMVSHSLNFNNEYYKGKGTLNAAIKSCKEELILKCKEKGADAIIGMKMEFKNPQKNEYHSIDGKVLIYGTAVKLK